MKKICFIAAAALTLAGCNQNEMNEPAVPAGLYFAHKDDSAERQSSDFSVSFSFLSDESWCTVVPVEIRAIGPMSDQPRRIAMEQFRFESIDKETAVPVALPADRDIKETKAWLYRQAQIEGKDLSTPEAVEAATKDGITAHYVDFNHPRLQEWVDEFGDSKHKNQSVSMPAGASNVWFPILVLKDPSLGITTSTKPMVDEATPLKIGVQLKPNEFFPSVIYNRDYSADGLRNINLSMTNMAAIPNNWGAIWSGTFKSYGPRKFEIMRTVTGFTDWNFVNSFVVVNQRNYWKAQCQMWLEKYAAAHQGAYPREPIKEGQPYSGKVVTFGKNY